MRPYCFQFLTDSARPFRSAKTVRLELIIFFNVFNFKKSPFSHKHAFDRTDKADTALLVSRRLS